MTKLKKTEVDCSQVQETVRMLNLAVAQIEISMKEGDDSVDTLIHTFTEMVSRVQIVESLAKEKMSHANDMQAIISQCEAVSTDMQRAIVAFQFYDKLTQQLNHISHSLTSLGEIVGDDNRLFNMDEWHLLQDSIKSKFSMAEEHEMFELIMQGMSIEEALKQTKNTSESKQNDIELF